MKNWAQRYSSKVSSLQDAMCAISPGRRILIGSGASEPNLLVEALITHGGHLADNEIVHLLTLGKAPYVEPEMQSRFRHTAFFIGANVRKAVAEGRADFMPVFLSEIPKLIRSRRIRIDVALVQVSPPDRYGFLSLGVAVDIVRAAVDTADLIIAEVNPQMPRTLGDSMIHISRVAHLVPVDYPLHELPRAELDETTRQIGRQVATLIPDGATLQTGIGKIPDAVLEALRDRHHLGVHTEMLSDGVIDLVEKDVITGTKKTVLPGKIVTSFAMGTKRLYDWIDDNPGIEMRPSEFTNDPVVVAANDHMIAINSALAVDLTGQVASDTLMGRFFSGIGGQVDFIRGAARSKGGKPIIALPSTAKDGELSRIRSTLEEGAGVVTSRGDVHYVVTEFGVADLWGKNIRERTTALIDIAHPDFRSELLAEAKHRRYVFADQKAPAGVYPWSEERTVTLKNGKKLLIRPIRTSDMEPVQDLLYRLSNESTYTRFMHHKKTHPREEMQMLVDLDYDTNMGIIASLADHPDVPVSIARYDLDPATNLADIAFVVADAAQGQGIGTAMMRRMAEIGEARGLGGFSADVLSANKAMLNIFHHCGLEVSSDYDSGAYTLVMRYPERPPASMRFSVRPPRTAGRESAH